MVGNIETPNLQGIINYGSNNFRYVRLHTKTISGVNRILDDNDNIMNFNQIVSLFEDESIFLYLISANVIHIPSFHEKNAIAFIGNYYIREESHMSRTIINNENVVLMNDIWLEEQDYKSTEITEESTDKEYPSAKAVYDFVMSKIGG